MRKERWSHWKTGNETKIRGPVRAQGNVAPKWTIEAFIQRITQTVLFLFYFFVSSICSTSLDSSTTLPLIMVCVTTFTILRVRTSGSSAERKTERAVWYVRFFQTAGCRLCGRLCLAVFNVCSSGERTDTLPEHSRATNRDLINVYQQFSRLQIYLSINSLSYCKCVFLQNERHLCPWNV